MQPGQAPHQLRRWRGGHQAVALGHHRLVGCPRGIRGAIDNGTRRAGPDPPLWLVQRRADGSSAVHCSAHAGGPCEGGRIGRLRRLCPWWICPWRKSAADAAENVRLVCLDDRTEPLVLERHARWAMKPVPSTLREARFNPRRNLCLDAKLAFAAGRVVSPSFGSRRPCNDVPVDTPHVAPARGRRAGSSSGCPPIVTLLRLKIRYKTHELNRWYLTSDVRTVQRSALRTPRLQ